MRVACVEEIARAVSLVLADVAGVVALTEEKEFDIKLILNELLVNSLEHSEARFVRVVFQIEKRELRCCIMDGGCGFDISCCKNLNCPDVFSESGRGIFLASSVADWIRYNKKGNMVLFGYTI